MTALTIGAICLMTIHGDLERSTKNNTLKFGDTDDNNDEIDDNDDDILPLSKGQLRLRGRLTSARN